MKKYNDLPKIVVVKETVLSLIVCASIPPENINEIPDMVFELLRSPGTNHGRWELPDFQKNPETQPLECNDYEGRWHYFLIC